MKSVAKHECAPEHAARMLDWIANRGGVAVWQSINVANLGASWSTPATLADGQPATKPTWQVADAPERIITDARDIEVVTRREVKRFHVGVFALKLTDGATRKVRAAVEKAGEGASYEFDYSTQEAVITVPGEHVLLSDWTPPAAPAESSTT